MKILYCAAEASPFISTGGLGDVAGSLPQVLVRNGVECRVVCPLYAGIAEEYKAQMKEKAAFTVTLGWRKQPCRLFTIEQGGVLYYFLQNEYYFDRANVYGYEDDGERFAFFSKAILEMLSYIDFVPQIVHTNDWHSALVNVYLKQKQLQKSEKQMMETVFTIHNVQYQGVFGMEILEDVLGFTAEEGEALQKDGGVNFMKGGVVTAGCVTTVSPTYAKELLNPFYAYGMEQVLGENQEKLVGILNGIDVQAYNPETDTAISQNYNAETVMQGKLQNKKALRDSFALYQPEEGQADNLPLIGMVTRLTGHKGVDLVQEVADVAVEMGAQFVLLGSGEEQYEQFFYELALRHPGMVGVELAFNPAAARRIYAGADLFLMPSKQEPCGLSQMVALRYGTVPVVRKTGGLADTITDVTIENGNGFVFEEYRAEGLLEAVSRAKAAYGKKTEWAKLVRHAMQCDNSWNSSAQEYIFLYKQLLQLIG